MCFELILVGRHIDGPRYVRQFLSTVFQQFLVQHYAKMGHLGSLSPKRFAIRPEGLVVIVSQYIMSVLFRTRIRGLNLGLSRI